MIRQILLLCVVLCAIFVHIIVASGRGKKDYQGLLQNPNVKYCDDKTLLLPECKECIPGTRRRKASGGFGSCEEFITPSYTIRKEIAKLTRERYGANLPSTRKFGLYPYLETPPFLVRQELFGSVISERRALNIVDIGAYYNPIHLFLSSDFCPKSVIIIEPILNPVSAYLPCSGEQGGFTHLVVLPVTFRFYMSMKNKFPKPDTVVCIGCDSYYGPNRRMLETAFERPFTLMMEYPSEYIHNGPFNKMLGAGSGENMTFLRTFEVESNETKYTKRVMKIIKYQASNN